MNGRTAEGLSSFLLPAAREALVLRLGELITDAYMRAADPYDLAEEVVAAIERADGK